MMRKLLPIGLGAIALTALIQFSFSESDSEVNYTPRAELNSSEPNFMRWAQLDVRTGEYNPAARNEAFNSLQNNASRANEMGLVFENLGPDNVGGRTKAILEVYGKPDTMLVGSVTGGMFISFDAGGTWQPHEQFKNLDSSSSIIASIHQDIYNGRIYVGTGSNFDALGSPSWPGYGIFVSDDDGLTFTHLSSTTPDNRNTNGGDTWLQVNRIRTDSVGNVYAATGKGLKKSTDQGDTWEDVIFIDQAMTFPTTAEFADVLVMTSGKVVASTSAGSIFYSDDGTAGTFEKVTQSGMPSGGMARTVLGGTPDNDDHFYCMFIEGNSCFNSVYETNNGGGIWTSVLFPFDDFTPMNNGQYCQGEYDAAFGVSPVNDDIFFLGGITLWRYDGNLTRVASSFGSPPFQDVFPNYVHSDQHYVYFSPNDPSRVYVTGDGGIAMSENDGTTWQGLNKGYTSTQYYSVAYANDGDMILGGTQDNGTLVVLGDNESDPKVGFSLSGGDGLGCDMSQISQIIITSSQNGVVYRIDAAQRNGSNFPVGSISSTGGPFNTVVRLWEDINDETSRDSVEFSVETTEIAIDVSNGVVKNYTATVEPVQPAAIVIGSSITVYSGDQILTVSEDDDEVLESTGSSKGTITYNSDGTFDLDVQFATAPSENSNIYVTFDQKFEANAVLLLESENLNSGLTSHSFEYRLEYALNPGDVILVQDPVQSILASTGGPTGTGTSGVRLYRNVLNFLENPVAIDVPGIGGSVTEMKFTSDGDGLFVGTGNGTLYRITGLKNLYTFDDLDELTVTSLSTATGPSITGISIDPNDDNHVVVTYGGYGGTSNVKMSTTAMTANSFTSIHNNLAPMPVYAAQIDRNDANIIVLGTEFGMWASADGGATWSDENNEVGYVPTYDVRQQTLPWELAKNSGTYFIGTHGKGMWKSGSLVGIDDVDPLPSRDDAIYSLKVFPNPMKDQGTIELHSGYTGNVDIKIYDINGRRVKDWQERVVNGTNQINVSTMNLRTGTYYAEITAGESREVAKIMVFK